jgi:hypothetical protein
MNQEGKEGSRKFLIPDEAQKKNLTSFSLDAEPMRDPFHLNYAPGPKIG